MKIAHLSDIHIWQYPRDPRLLLGKRLWGVAQLAAGRARRFRLERIDSVVERVRSLRPDHVLITGDLTTTSLPAEFAEARARLAPLLADPRCATVLPGNHDRYTPRSVRDRLFEGSFGDYLPAPGFPWLRPLDGETAILGLDPSRAHPTSRGWLPPGQLEAARSLIGGRPRARRRLIVACHYPLAAPDAWRAELASKRLVNAGGLREWLATIGPHLYCCGHVHAAWAFTPADLPGQLCLNAGAPLLHDPTGRRRPGFLEIDLDGPGVRVTHHAWDGNGWAAATLAAVPDFFLTDTGPRRAVCGDS
jgi:3',5'-cyclic AMP phosphodiesterase CpdA